MLLAVSGPAGTFPGMRHRTWIAAAVAALTITATAAPSAAAAPDDQPVLPAEFSTAPADAAFVVDAPLDQVRAVARPGDDVVQVGDYVRVEPADGQVVAAAEHVAHLGTVELDPVVSVAATPNDPYYPWQWGLEHAGFEQAWEITTGAADVKIAILDTGVATVPELAGKLGPGWDFIGGDDTPEDLNGHGTMSATVAAAVTNNGTGIAGACPACTVLPVKVLGDNGTGWHSSIAAGIDWAVDNDADVISMSLSSPVSSTLLHTAVQNAAANGVVVVAAAGNQGSTAMTYPAAYPEVISVAGIDEDGTVYEASNRSADWVDVAAAWCNLAQGHTAGYFWYCGTSSATPLVAAAAALLDHAGLTDPAGTLFATATPLTDVKYGTINLGSAIAGEQTPPSAQITSPAPGTRIGRLLPLSWATEGDIAGGYVEIDFAGTVVATRPATDRHANIVTTAFTHLDQTPVTVTLRLYASTGTFLSASQITGHFILAPGRFVWSNGTETLNSSGARVAHAGGAFGFGGQPGDRPLFCDFDGDGTDTPVVARPSGGGLVWLARNDLAGGNATQTVWFGAATDVPVCGDWNGDGTDGIGVFRDGRWMLRNTFTTGVAELSFGYGIPTDIPLTGDWNGDGTDTPGIARNGTFYLRNSASTGHADITVRYGTATDHPVVGDWNGDGIDTLAVFRNGAWLLRNTNSSGQADKIVWYGTSADVPFVGDFTGAGFDTFAVGR